MMQRTDPAGCSKMQFSQTAFVVTTALGEEEEAGEQKAKKERRASGNVTDSGKNAGGGS